ncbi:MAG: L28 family ribosomal protein, partial [Atribacterota bacterium]|nr:L28 family ribosomal protein [Atribacterota bacterium]
NIQKVRVKVDNTVKKLNVCTKCLKSGRVQKNG